MVIVVEAEILVVVAVVKLEMVHICFSKVVIVRGGGGRNQEVRLTAAPDLWSKR